MKIREILERYTNKLANLWQCNPRCPVKALEFREEIEAEIKALFDVEDIIYVLLRKEMEITKSTGFDATRRELAETLKEWWDKL